MCELSSMSSSCPALCRASTSFVVDGRVEPGHDGYGWGPRSRAHAEFALAGLAQFFGVAGEFGEQFAGIARVDDLLDPERLSGAEGRTQLSQPLLDLRDLRLRVVGGVNLRP